MQVHDISIVFIRMKETGRNNDTFYSSIFGELNCISENEAK